MTGQLGFWPLAQAEPDRLALVEPDGTEYSAGELLALVNRTVAGLRSLGLSRGDAVAVLLPNGAPMVALMLATAQAGLYLVPVNYHLVGPEIAYIVADSGAKALIVHERYAVEAERAAAELELPPEARFAVGAVAGFLPIAQLHEGQPDSRPEDRSPGAVMNYTSGTTGRPKGVRRALPEGDPDEVAVASGFLHALFGIAPLDGHVHLTVAPLYHTAVGAFTQSALHAGHAVVLMDRWTPEGTLERIARYGVTTSHMVPTMFHRLLQLPEETRAAYDISSLRCVIHSAAPCPVPTKQRMLEWWGPVIWEYYAATEGGGTIAGPQAWLDRPGTVGTAWPGSAVVVLDDDGAELPPGQIGTVWMSMGDRRFEYHGDPEKTRRSWNDRGLFTVGDAGELDAEGWLFLRDRKVDMIISGGVNIYPAETEAALLQHPAVADAAVFGVPDDDLGEQVKAAVQVGDGVEPGPDLERELLAHCAANLARYKVPRSIDFVADFPRDPNGKVYKRRLRDPYWAGRTSQLV